MLFLATVVLVWTAWRFLSFTDRPDDRLALPQSIASSAVVPVADARGAPPIRAEGSFVTARTPARFAFAAPAIGSIPGRSAPQPALSATRDGEAAIEHERQWLRATRPGMGGAPPLVATRPLFELPVRPGTDAALAGTGDPPRGSRRDRWSLYGWALVRQGGGPRALVARPQYGRSQVGLMLRFRPGGRFSPDLYLRASAALGSSDSDLALGVAISPERFAWLQLAAEQRLGLGGGARSAPAAYVAAYLPEVPGPGGVRGYGYGQAGILGLKDSQVFFDLQLLAERTVAEDGLRRLSLGGGVWAAGQSERLNAEGERDWTYRVDAGARAALDLPVADGDARLALDWRQRIGGNADPGHGLALTLSTAF